MNAIKELWSNVQAWFTGLTQRERTLVSLAAAALLGFVLFLTLYTSASNAAATRRRTEQKLEKLATVQELAGNFRQAEAVRRNTERQLAGSNLQLISYIEERGTAAGLDIPALNPKGDVPLGDGKIIESSVELTLTDVPLGKLYNFLTTVEQGPGLVKVKYLRMEPRNELVTAWINIAAYKTK